MRRIALLLLALTFALPSATLAARTAVAARTAPGDGSLVVSNADGTLTVQVKGVIFGHFDKGKMTIVGDYKPDVANSLITVSSAKMDIKGAKPNVVYSGNDVRFLIPSGTVTLRFEGSGVDLSAVGKGTVKVTGKSSLEDGTVSVNGLKATPLPTVATFGGASLTVTATVEKSSTTVSASTSSSSGR